MNFGTIYLDFYEPIKLSDSIISYQTAHPSIDLLKMKESRMKFNESLGYQIIYKLQKHLRITPATLVAAILLLYRKGITEDQLLKKISWLGMILINRGATITTDGVLPSQYSLKIGLTHLGDYIVKNRNIYSPKVQIVNHKQDFSNYIMLCYYRNALNYVFFNESVVVCSMFSFGEGMWDKGVDYEELFTRACFLADLIKREEVLKDRINKQNRAYFDELVAFMQEQRLVQVKDVDGKRHVFPKSSGEAIMLMIGSICWPMVDTYYIVLVFALSLAKNKNVEEAKVAKDV
jgi:glycerone phosphate O-acyltransferase/fatty acyl-CoA reductase